MRCFSNSVHSRPSFLIPTAVMASPKARQPHRHWQTSKDKCLTRLVREAGQNVDWKKIANALPGRTNFQCRTHWYDVLDPSIKKASWSLEEDRLLSQLHQQLDNSWTEISKQITGRTGKQCWKKWTARLAASSTTQGANAAQRASTLGENEVREKAPSRSYVRKRSRRAGYDVVAETSPTGSPARKRARNAGKRSRSARGSVADRASRSASHETYFLEGMKIAVRMLTRTRG